MLSHNLIWGVSSSRMYCWWLAAGVVGWLLVLWGHFTSPCHYERLRWAWWAAGPMGRVVQVPHNHGSWREERRVAEQVRACQEQPWARSSLICFFFACFHFKQMLCCEKHLGWGWVEGGRGSMGFVGPCQDCQQTIHCLTRIQCPWLIPAFYFIIFFPREINDIF